MDGIIANLQGVCDLAEKYDAMVMVDDSHAVGFVGKHGRGSAEHCGVEGRVDIITGTLGKALGGASGGYTSGKREVVDWLRQRSRPYLFSNTLMPAIAGASLKVFDLIEKGDALREQPLRTMPTRFRAQMTKLGFTLAGAGHPIIPVMLGDAALAQQMAAKMLERGIYVIGFSFPVVPKGQARIRTQMSAAHSPDDIDRRRSAAFGEVGQRTSDQVIRTMMSNMMRALVKAKAEPGIWMEEVPVPEIGPNDVLIKVKKTAICGTDVHIYNWDQWAQKTVPVPMVTGHEFVGTVADFGAAVTEYKVGQRVSGEGHIVCGHCRNCRAGRGHLCRNTLGVGVNRPGAFGEYLAIPQHNVVPIPDDVPDEIAAIFDPLGNAVHTALSFDLVGEDVLVTGAGPIGIMGALVAQCVGARKVVITDINPVRLALAKKLGVQHVVDASKEKLRDVMRDDRHDRRFRRRPRNVGRGARLPRHDRHDEQWRQDRHPRHRADRLRDRLEQGHLQDAASQGHLRPRDVRDLVQDDRAGAGPARRHRPDHPPHRRRRLHRRLRGDEERQFRQGGDGLVRAALGRDSRARHLRHERPGAARFSSFVRATMTLLYHSGLSNPGLDCHLARQPLTGGWSCREAFRYGPGKQE